MKSVLKCDPGEPDMDNEAMQYEYAIGSVRNPKSPIGTVELEQGKGAMESKCDNCRKKMYLLNGKMIDAA